MWKKKLEHIADGKKMAKAMGSVAAQTRAKYILSKRNVFSKGVAGGQIDMPYKSIGFFSFEENLHHQVNEAKMMISCGLTCTFFENQYVRKTLQDLQPRHRPVYRKKLLRLVRCVIDESGEEVRFQFNTHSDHLCIH